MAWAEAEANGTLRAFMHVGDVDERVQDHVIDIAGLREELQQYQAQMQRLVQMEVSTADALAFVQKLLPPTAGDDGIISKRAQGLAEANWAQVLQEFNTNNRDTLTGNLGRSRYGMLQAVTYYLDHREMTNTRDEGTLYVDGLIGDADGIKQQALQLLSA
jgi:hypothetical protein